MENEPKQLDMSSEELRELAEYAKNMKMDQQFGGAEQMTMKEAKMQVELRKLARLAPGNYRTNDDNNPITVAISKLTNLQMTIICVAGLLNCFAIYNKWFAGGKKTRHTKRNNKRKSKRNNKKKSKRKY